MRLNVISKALKDLRFPQLFLFKIPLAAMELKFCWKFKLGRVRGRQQQNRRIVETNKEQLNRIELK